jgi:hypothetical protein
MFRGREIPSGTFYLRVIDTVGGSYGEAKSSAKSMCDGPVVDVISYAVWEHWEHWEQCRQVLPSVS